MPPRNDDHPPRLRAPRGTCDTNIHVYDRRYPRAPTATMDPPDASVADYLKVCGRLGIERTIVVQPTIYGTDNRCTLEAMAALGARARGIAVVDESVSDAELDRLTKLGIRGIRFHMLAGGVLPWGILETMAARVRPFNWIIQLQFDGRDIPEWEALIRRVPNTLIIDHVGKFLEPVSVRHPAFRALLRLTENDRTYVKLAGPYETSKSGPPNYDDVGALAKVLVDVAPERMIWASNWPQVNPPNNIQPDNAELLDLLLDWIPDEATRAKVLVDNPARLYGF